eukprot:gene40937-54203_t
MVATHKKPEPFTYALPGPTTRVGLNMAVDSFHRIGKATNHDVVVSGALAEILSGGATDVTKPMTEDDLTALE